MVYIGYTGFFPDIFSDDYLIYFNFEPILINNKVIIKFNVVSNFNTNDDEPSITYSALIYNPLMLLESFTNLFNYLGDENLFSQKLNALFFNKIKDNNRDKIAAELWNDLINGYSFNNVDISSNAECNTQF